MAKLTFYGHAACGIETDDGTRLVIDPFFADNPLCDVPLEDIPADYVLLTHGHFDHVSDAVPLLERTNATVIATFEIASFLESKGFQASPHNIGGGVTYPFGYVRMTPALHTGSVQLPGADGLYTLAGGFLINLNSGLRFHHTGDTALISDMQLLQGRVDVVMMPIGDRYTMGPDDAVRAVEMMRPKVVIPCHYNTWPPIEQDPEAFRSAVGSQAEVRIVAPGETIEI